MSWENLPWQRAAFAGVRNVSSPFTVAGSDVDLEWWMPTWCWSMITALFAALHIGHAKRSKTYRVELSPLCEMFFIDADAPDEVTLALQHNLATMRGWDEAGKAAYLAAKERISDLQGPDRKHAKAELAVRFGLNPIVYGC